MREGAGSLPPSGAVFTVAVVSRTPLLNLRVDAETKARWEAAAADRGYGLSEFIRGCVEAEIAGPVGLKVVVAPPVEVRPVVPKVLPPPRVVPPRVDPQAGKRSYEPDFKKGSKGK